MLCKTEHVLHNIFCNGTKFLVSILAPSFTVLYVLAQYSMFSCIPYYPDTCYVLSFPLAMLGSRNVAMKAEVSRKKISGPTNFWPHLFLYQYGSVLLIEAFLKRKREEEETKVNLAGAAPDSKKGRGLIGGTPRF